ncbi:MAG: AsmA family protein [Myxococcales bacterium]|nr:AsmA family protein [Myxococcales bacterium]
MNGLKILGILAALVLAVVVGLIVVLNSIDWSAYQEPIVAAVEDATGRKLGVDGAIGVSIGLSPRVSVDGVSFQNAPFGSRPEMAKLEHFSVRLKLLPLLTGSVEVATVELSGLDLILETDADGNGNWVLGEEARTDAPEPEAPGTLGVATLVRSVVIEDIRLVYRDGQTGDEQNVVLERLVASMPDDDGPLSISLRGGVNDETVELEGMIEGAARVLDGGPLGLALALRAGGARVSVDGEVGDPLAGAGLALEVSIEGDSLADFSGLAGSPLPDLGPYRLAMLVSDAPDVYRLKNLSFRMGSSEIAGSVSVNLAGERPSLDVSLRSKRVDLADFQDADSPAEAGEDAPPPADGRLLPADALPFDGLHAADARVKVAIDELVANDVSIEAVEVVAKLAGGRLAIDPLVAKLAGGSIRASAVVTAARKLPAVAATLGIDGVEVGALLSTLDISDLLEGGAIDFDLDIAGSGASPRAIAASLNGDLAFTIGTGTVQNAWAELVLSDLGSILSGAGSGNRTALNCAMVKFDVKRGVARARELAVDTKGLVLYGSGGVDLRDESLDLRFDPLPKSNNLTAAMPPALVGGSFLAPEFSIDAVALAAKGVGASLQLAGDGKLKGVERVATSPGLAGCRELVARRGELTEKQKPSNALGQAVEDVLGDKAPPGIGNAVKSLFDAFGR